MEISLDIDFIRATLAYETQRARTEINRDGLQRAYENSRERHDARVVNAPDAGTLACRGCSWCCYFSVDVRAVEVFSILEFVERTLAPEAKARIYSEVRANSETLRGLDDVDRMRRNVKCPFLSEGRCTIYAARPQTCRNYHATSAEGCKQSYEDPENFDIDPEFAPYVYQAGGAHVDAFAKAMSEAGFDTNVYELNSALDAALADPQARVRFESKLPPFAQLAGDEVAAEFEELAADESKCAKACKHSR